MRLWLRLTLLMAALTLVPLAVTGAMAVRATRENATLRPEEAMSREATALATFVGSWIDAQAQMLGGWGKVWDVSQRGDDYRIGLLRAAWSAIDAAVTVALVDSDGKPVVPAQFLLAGAVQDQREPGSDARAGALLKQLPSRMGPSGYAVGTPYLPPGGETPVVPIVAQTRAANLRLAGEISLAPIVQVFAERPEMVAVLVDGFGRPVLGGDHPLLHETDLGALLDRGLDLTFSTPHGDDLLQGAVWSVPHTDWKVVVLAPPALAERVAGEIRRRTFAIAALALAVVALVGFVIERTLTRSVGELRAHADAVTHGNYGERNFVDTSDEIGDLALALNEMSLRLETTDAELRAFHEELQARVEARTRELEAAQAQLVRAGQMAAVAEIGAGLAHELNNPLAAILGQVQLVQASGTVPSRTALARIEAQAQRCREVVETMLRLSSGKVDTTGGEVLDLRGVLDEALAQVRPLFEQRRVELDIDVPDAPLRSPIERGFALRVLVKLLEALAAGLGEGARLRVEARAGTRAEVALIADRPVGVGSARDDWRSAGLRFWSARGLLELAGGRVEQPEGVEGCFVAVFPEAG